MVKRCFFLLLFIVSAIRIFADLWEPTEIFVTYSENKEYMLIVYPKVIPDNFHSYRYQRLLKKGVLKDSIQPCHAILYHIRNTDTITIWNKPLINAGSPVSAVVANDGKSVVTFNEWGWLGLIHPIVIYGELGELIKDISLEEISPFPINQYHSSRSSIYWSGESEHWRGKGEYLDNDRIEISFVNKDNELRKRIVYVRNGAFE